jgi:uncharacterized protein involved in exopolysaccharide biosynthesis
MPTYAQLLDLSRTLRRILERHRRNALIVFCSVAFLAFVGTLLMPRSYYSEARLFVRFGRENLVDPTATGGQMVSLYESRESEINSLIEILKSRAILDRVVKELGPAYILSGKESKAVSQAETNNRPSPAAQRAVAQLERTVTVWPPRKTNIIIIGCKAESPAMAQRIVAKFVEVYLDEHVRVHRASGSYEFFEHETQKSLARWRKAADQLRDTKNRLGIVTIEGQRKKFEDQISTLNTQLLANRSELKTSQGKIAALQQLINSLPEKIVTQVAEGPSGAFDGMRQTLYQLEAQQQELAAKMQDSHPRLAAISQQVEDLRAILAKQPPERAQATEALNPSRQALELSRLAESAQAEALQARERSLVASQQQVERELQEFNAQAIVVEQLQQQVALAEANHKDYSQKLEQARISRSLDDERISSISLVQPASYIATATGPRRAVVLALGLVIAALSGVGTALIAAWLNPLITTAEQLASILNVPLTGSIPAEVATAA